MELLRRGYAVRTTVRSPSREQAVRAALAPLVNSTDPLTFAAADLTRDGGWEAAVAGCDHVLHVASPLGADAPRDRDALIGPARDGTLRVLRAATRAGVRRVVMTSSTAAATPTSTDVDSIGEETVWTDPDDPRLNAYRRSKVLAERAAWDFMAEHAGPTTLTTILPGAVFGPVMTTANLGSVQVIQRLLEGRPPGVPRLGFWIVDVRDLADLHVRALTATEAGGQRFIAVSQFMWMREMAATLRARLGERASRVPTRSLPDSAVRLLALFVPSLRAVTPGLGHRRTFNSEKARRVLGFSPRAAATTVVDCAESLIAAIPARTNHLPGEQ